MKKFSKILALVLALAMIFSLAACSGGTDPTPTPDAGGEATPTPDAGGEETPDVAVSADDIPDNMSSSDGKYQIAFVTDVGLLKDKSFNQGTYDGVKLYAANNKLSYKYYQPANKDQATDDDRCV